MSRSRPARLEADARAIWDAGLDAVEPGSLVRQGLGHDLDDAARILVLGAGKAGAAMATAARELLGERIIGGALAVPPEQAGRIGPVELLPSSHPLPSPAGEAAARKILGLARSAGPEDHVLGLISGGGSALMPLPAEGLRLADKADTTGLLLRSGGSIHEMNQVRRHLSAVKGGWLGAACHPAPCLALLISDVPGDDPAAIASGPFAPDPSRFADAWAVLESQGLLDQVRPAVREHLRAGLAGEIPETPKPGDLRLALCRNRVIGIGATALAGATARASRLGYRVETLQASWTGPVEEAVRLLVERVQHLRNGPSHQQPVAILLAGEPHLRVDRPGRGGRCTHLTLLAATRLAGHSGLALLAAGTDGRDGASGAAGALVTGETTRQLRSAGIDPAAALADFDSATALERVNSLVVTGPTGTNVSDLMVLLVHP